MPLRIAWHDHPSEAINPNGTNLLHGDPTGEFDAIEVGQAAEDSFRSR
jgi:hypothetical protein